MRPRERASGDGAPGAASGVERVLLAGVAVGLAVLVWAPITRNYFSGDDWLNLSRIVNDPTLDYVLDPIAGHIDIVRRVIFCASHALFGTAPAPYFWTVLLSHLVNVALLFVLVCRTTGSPRVAWLASVLWAVAPTHEATLGWYSAYSYVLATGFLLVLVLDLLGSPVDTAVSGRLALRWAGLVLLGAINSGIGIAVGLAFPLVLVVLFPPRRISRAAWVVALVLPPAIVAGYLFLHRRYMAPYGGSVHALGLGLSNMAVTWRSVVGMLVHLLDASLGTLLLGPTFVRLPPPRPVQLALAAGAVAGVGWLLATAPRACRRIAALLLLVTAAGYGMIAVGRAGLLAQVADYGAWTPRYQYAGTATMAALLALVVARLDPGAVPRRLRDGLVVAGTALVAGLWLSGGWIVDHHDADRRAAAESVARLRTALATAPPDRPVYLPNDPFPTWTLPYGFFGTASVYTIFFPHETRPVYFVERNPKVLELVPPGSRIAQLITATPRP